jgi:hypothetical protein
MINEQQYLYSTRECTSRQKGGGMLYLVHSTQQSSLLLFRDTLSESIDTIRHRHLCDAGLFAFPQCGGGTVFFLSFRPPNFGGLIPPQLLPHIGRNDLPAPVRSNSRGCNGGCGNNDHGGGGMYRILLARVIGLMEKFE